MKQDEAMTKLQTKVTFALIATSIVAGALTAAPAAATPSFDGSWSVVIVTDKGTCDRSYRYPVRISKGEVLNDGPSLVNVSGKVANNGAVKVLVSAGDKSAMGVGKLGAAKGGGSWSGGECSGRWEAERHD
jgi:hypothetical protein